MLREGRWTRGREIHLAGFSFKGTLSLMHELSIAEEILTVAKSHSGPGRRVKKIAVVIGPFAGVVRESLEFCFDLAAKHFGLEGTRLSIEELTAVGVCSACGETGEVDSMWTECGGCGHSPMTVDGGKELRITQLEIEEAENV
jgi:hydrogenase nickel insertion protein HypA